MLSEASVYEDTVDGKKENIRQCGWVLYNEIRTEYSTMRFYKVVCPVSVWDAYTSDARTTVLYYAIFSNGVLFSIRWP